MNTRKYLIAAALISSFMIAACTVPSWVTKAEADAEIAVPIAASLIDVIDPALSPLVDKIETGFSALTKTLDAFKSQPTGSNLQAVQAAFQAVDANVADLENAAQIKNAATRNTVTAVVQLLSQAIVEIAALVPASTNLQVAISPTAPGPGLKSIVNAQAQGLSAKDLKKQFNSIIKGDPRFKPLP